MSAVAAFVVLSLVVASVAWLFPLPCGAFCACMACRAKRLAESAQERAEQAKAEPEPPDGGREVHVAQGEHDPLGWHAIGGTHLLELLRRCERGEKADMVYAELWANAEHEDVDG